jgi:hypothetical protein
VNHLEGPHPEQQPEEAKTTAQTIGAAGAASVALGAATGGLVPILLGIVFLLAAAYEFYAIVSDEIPTITELVKHRGWPARIAVVVIAVLGFVDHFITGVIL